MTREKKPGSGVYFSAEELYPALLLILCAFLKTVAVAATDAGTTLFYLARGTDHLLTLPCCAAILLTPVWVILDLVSEKSPRVPAVLLFVAAAISVLFCAGSFFTGSPVYGLLCLTWKFGFCTLAEAAFWVAAFRFGLFGKESRFLFPVLFATAAGWFAGGVFIDLFAGKYPAQTLCFAAVPACCAAFILNVLAKNGDIPVLNRLTFDGQEADATDPLREKLLRRFMIVSGLLFFAAGTVFVQFLSDPALSAPDGGAVLGPAYMLAAVLLLSFLSIRKIGNRRGVTKGLYLFPILLLFFCRDAFPPFPETVFIYALFTVSLFVREAALQTVPQAVSFKTGYRAVIVRKSMLEPMTLNVICVLSIPGVPVGCAGTKPFYLALAAVLFVSIALLNKTYQAFALSRLDARSWRGGVLPAGKKISRWLKKNLESGDSQNVLYALRVVEEAEKRTFPQYLKQALRHPNDDVRLFALAKIEELNAEDLLPDVVDLTQADQSDAVRRTAVRVMCRLGGAEERERALSLIDDPVLREGVLAGFLAVGREGVFTAVKNVADLSVSEKKEDRLTAADALGDAGNRAFCQPLTALLDDPDEDVCKAALTAAGKLTEPALLPAVINAFCRPDLTEEAAKALSCFGKSAFKDIDAFLLSADRPVGLKLRLIGIVAGLASPAAEKFLFDHIRIENRRLRFGIVKALFDAEYKPAGKDDGVIRLCLYDDLEKATGLLAAVDAFDKQEPSRSLDLLKDALNDEIRRIKERVLLLTALLYPSKQLRAFLSDYAPDENEKAVGLIDKFPSGELKTICLSLFENKTAQQRLAVLRPQFFPPVLTVDGYLRLISEMPDGEITDETRARAAEAAGEQKDSGD